MGISPDWNVSTVDMLLRKLLWKKAMLRKPLRDGV